MSIGPLRRSIGALGLIVLMPLAWMVSAGTVSAVDAATRATVALIGVTAVGRLTSLGVSYLASSLEEVPVDRSRQVAEGRRPHEPDGVESRDPDLASDSRDGTPHP